MKNIFLILILILLSNCGYSSVYKDNKDINFKIVLHDMKGDKSINRIIRTNLERYSEKESEKIYSVETESIFSKSILTKDKTGKATDIRLNFNIKFTVKTDNKVEYFTFEENLNISNSLDSYEQANYENIIKNNFINSIIKEFIVKLRLV